MRTDGRRSEQVAFALLLSLYLLPLWIFPYVPSQDGPIHLANAVTWWEYDAPGRAIFRDYYIPNSVPSPNWLAQVLLAALSRVAAPPLAEKLLVSLYVLGLPLALRFALESVRSGAGFLAVLGLPFVYGFCLNMGFYNFCFGVALYVLAFGYWIRVRERPTPAGMGLLAALGLAVYFAHVVAIAALVGSIAGVAALEAASGAGWRPRRFARLLLRRAGPPALACVPALALTFWFVDRKGGVAPPTGDLTTIVERLRNLVTFDYLIAFGPLELVPLVLAHGLLGVCALHALRSGRTEGRDPLRLALLLATLLFLAAALFGPRQTLGGAIIPPRFVLLAVLLGILWLGRHPFPASARRRVLAVGALAAGVALQVTGVYWAAASADLEEYTQCAAHIEPASTLLSLSYAPISAKTPSGFERVRPHHHAAARIAAERRLVGLNNYSAYQGHHPLLYRPEVRPKDHLGCVECVPPSADPGGYRRNTPGRVDYVLLWSPSLDASGDGIGKLGSVGPQLAADYEVVCVSEPQHLAWLLRRR